MSGIEGGGFGSFDKLEPSLSKIEEKPRLPVDEPKKNSSGLSDGFFPPVDYGDPDSDVVPPPSPSGKIASAPLDDAYFAPSDSGDFVESAAASTGGLAPKDLTKPQLSDRSGKLHL